MQTALFNDIQQRQKRVLDSLGDDILVLASGVPVSAIGLFRQDNDFAYLTGFPEMGAVAIFDPAHDSENVTLFVKEKDRKEEVWDGFAIGPKETKSSFPVDKVYGIKQFEDEFKKRVAKRRVFFKEVLKHPQEKLLSEGLKEAAEVCESGRVYDQLVLARMVKSEWEIAQIRAAVDITTEAHHACMRAATKCSFEYELQAEFEYHCKRRGSLHQAFGTIVAAGANGTCQHYVENSAAIGKNDLVLIDAGAEWNLYASDITRTFPVSGKFTQLQRDLYDVVLASEKAGIEAVRPGARFFDLHRTAALVYVDGLKDLGFLHGSTEAIIEKEAYKEFWPAGLSHMMGLYVHDVAPKNYRDEDTDIFLKPGMVITVEPGFYSQDFNHQLPAERRNIGIRIEDDVLVTEDGYENLSAAIVKEVDDVEAMINNG